MTLNALWAKDRVLKKKLMARLLNALASQNERLVQHLTEAKDALASFGSQVYSYKTQIGILENEVSALKSKIESAEAEPKVEHVMWHSNNGVLCYIRRSHLGNWCGYIAVSRGHPWSVGGMSGVAFDYDISWSGSNEDFVNDLYSDITPDLELLVGCPEELWWCGFHRQEHEPALAKGRIMTSVNALSQMAHEELIKEAESIAEESGPIAVSGMNIDFLE